MSENKNEEGFMQSYEACSKPSNGIEFAMSKEKIEGKDCLEYSRQEEEWRKGSQR